MLDPGCAGPPGPVPAEPRAQRAVYGGADQRRQAALVGLLQLHQPAVQRAPPRGPAGAGRRRGGAAPPSTNPGVSHPTHVSRSRRAGARRCLLLQQSPPTATWLRRLFSAVSRVEALHRVGERQHLAGGVLGPVELVAGRSRFRAEGVREAPGRPGRAFPSSSARDTVFHDYLPQPQPDDVRAVVGAELAADDDLQAGRGRGGQPHRPVDGSVIGDAAAPSRPGGRVRSSTSVVPELESYDAQVWRP